MGMVQDKVHIEPFTHSIPQIDHYCSSPVIVEKGFTVVVIKFSNFVRLICQDCLEQIDVR